MIELQITSVCQKTILSGSVLTLALAGIPISPYCIRTTKKKHAESGQPVCARVVPVRWVFEFETWKEGTAGSSVAQNLSGRAMELCCIGSGLTSRLKNANKRSSTSQRESGLRTWVAGFWTLQVFSLTGRTNFSTFMVLIRRKKGPALRNTWQSSHPQNREFMRSLINRMFAEASGCDVTKRIAQEYPFDRQKDAGSLAGPMTGRGTSASCKTLLSSQWFWAPGEVFLVDELWLSQEKPRAASRVEALPPLHWEVEPRSEREIIEAALAESRGRVSGPSGAAAKLGIPPSTLDHKIEALKIDKRRFKFV
jgi:hypothetical protein